MTETAEIDYSELITLNGWDLLGGAERMRYLADVAERFTVEDVPVVMEFFKMLGERQGDDIMLPSVAFRVALQRVGMQALDMPKDEAEAHRRICFDTAIVYSAWMTKHNFR